MNNLINTTNPTMAEMLFIFHEWKDKEHLNDRHEIVFQNEQFNLNVKFTDKSFQQIQKNGRGFENIPQAIKNPSEIWMQWEDKKQRIVLSNYILFGKFCYIVQVREGIIINAFLTSLKGVEKFRKGCPIKYETT